MDASHSGLCPPFHLEIGANDTKIILWWGLQAPRFFTSGRDIWAEIGWGKVGLSGNILVKSNIPKSTFDVFDIREVYSQNIQNMRKICLLGFSIQRLWGKSLKISRNVSIGPLFSK